MNDWGQQFFLFKFLFFYPYVHHTVHMPSRYFVSKNFGIAFL